MEQNWDIIGHQNIVKFLISSIKQNRLASTYLFYGIEGLGKTAVAEKFAQEIIGSGKSATTELYPLKVEEGKKDISIEQVRQWRRALSLKSFSDQYKVGIIYEGEKLNRQSANALLKTIEEPTDKTVIIIITSDWQKLLDTIISRSIVVRFLPVPSSEIKKDLADKIKDKDKLNQIVGLSNGRPGIASGLVDDEELFSKYDKYLQLIFKLFKADINQRWQVIAELLDSLKDLQSKAKAALTFLDNFESVARSLLLKNIEIDYLNPKESINSNINISSKKALNLLYLTDQAKSDLKGNVQPKLILENLLLNL